MKFARFSVRQQFVQYERIGFRAGAPEHHQADDLELLHIDAAMW